jgi:penicillin G amidase
VRAPATGVALLILGAASTWFGTQGWGSIPPVGALLSPSVGLWANTQQEFPRIAEASTAGPGDSVPIRSDRRGVPHIFATSERDAVRALGYVVARDRLFQLELQSRAGEGTLTELVGDVALTVDQETRHLGMPRAAEKRLAALEPNSATAELLTAYADGINAYRSSLSPAQWPVEYKLLQRAPRPWLPVYSLHMQNRMGYTLAHKPAELDLLAARATIGDSAARALFDSDSPVQEPIQPAFADASRRTPRNGPRDALVPLPPPGQPDSAARALYAALTAGSEFGPLHWTRDADASPEEQALLQGARAFASNNWAVAPARSASGTALLAGDPHLELTLPSIWYEAHLVVPGVLDAGGVTVPGLPGIVIGFTRAFAWSFTNTGADVMDFWRETVDQNAQPTRYELDGTLVPLVDTRVEQYRDKAGQLLATDTVYYTHRGPMRRQGREWLSMRWTVLDGGDELIGFMYGQRAATAEAFLDSMARYYAAPAQNMIVADTSGTIAIRSTGKYPIRADSGRGTEIRDGRLRRNDWIGYRDVAQYPQSVRPVQGFLASANQQPIDPQDDRLYMGVDSHYEIWRALQINRLLRADSAMTADKMRQFQTDPGSVRAERLVPVLLQAATERLRQPNPPKSLEAARTLLGRWDRRYTADNTGARLFETAIGDVTYRLYDELRPQAGQEGKAPTPPQPSESRLLQLIADSANGWWDDRTTRDLREDRDRLLSDALAWAYDTLTVQFGGPAATPWRWGRTSPAQPMHLLRLSGFSAPATPINGGRGTLNPSVASRRANFGASWRMVADMQAQPIVRATYPGGQSGNPASPRYLDRFGLWATGTLDSVRTPRSPQELKDADVMASLMLRKAVPK